MLSLLFFSSLFLGSQAPTPQPSVGYFYESCPPRFQHEPHLEAVFLNTPEGIGQPLIPCREKENWAATLQMEISQLKAQQDVEKIDHKRLEREIEILKEAIPHVVEEPLHEGFFPSFFQIGSTVVSTLLVVGICQKKRKIKGFLYQGGKYIMENCEEEITEKELEQMKQDLPSEKEDFCIDSNQAPSPSKKTIEISSLNNSPDKPSCTLSNQHKKITFLERGKEVRQCLRHTSTVMSVCWSSDDAYLATASLDTAHIWDAKTGKEVRKLLGHTNFVTSVSWSSDDALLATASGDRTVRIWDAKTGKEVRKFLGHTHYVWSVRWSHNDAYLASASYDKTVRIWAIFENPSYKFL
jgi:hypothetical protein